MRQVPFSAQQVISSIAGEARSVFAADVDGDGNLDVLSASARCFSSSRPT